MGGPHTTPPYRIRTILPIRMITSSSAHHSRHMLAAPASAVVRPWPGAMHALSAWVAAAATADDWGMRSHWAAAAAAFWAGAWAAAAGLLLLGCCCWAAAAGLHGPLLGYMRPLTMTVAAASRAGHLAGQPGECESVHVWLVTARGVQQRRGWPALPRRTVRRGLHLTIQLPSCSPTAFDQHSLDS